MASKIDVRLILELYNQGVSRNEIAKTRHMSRSSVTTVVKIAREKNISYEDIKEMDDDSLYKLFFPNSERAQDIFEVPDYDYVNEELKKTGVTLTLLWKEYCDDCHRRNTLPYGKSKFFKDYDRYCAANNITARLKHRPGQSCEVDWSGPTMSIVDRYSKKKTTVYLFVSCLSYSRYSYVEPTLDMKMDTWLRCHVHMYEFFGGVPAKTVCDNLKTGVVKHPKEGDITLTEAYESLGLHYVTAIMPAGVKKPKHKPSVENTVGNIATAIIARLRNVVFSDFRSLQIAVAEKLHEYNEGPFQKRVEDGTRAQAHEAELEFLRPLPAVRFEARTVVKDRKVYPNCHISLAKNWYSVPSEYRGRSVDIHYTENIVEVYYNGRRISSHPKFPSYVENKYSTRKEDMPDWYNQPEMNKDRICSWASAIGKNTRVVIDRIFESVQIPEQGYNPALSVLNLSKKFSKGSLEDACSIALGRARSPRYRLLNSILCKEKDIKTAAKRMNIPVVDVEKNNREGFVRGATYYGGGKDD